MEEPKCARHTDSHTPHQRMVHTHTYIHKRVFCMDTKVRLNGTLTKPHTRAKKRYGGMHTPCRILVVVRVCMNPSTVPMSALTLLLSYIHGSFLEPQESASIISLR